VRFSAIYAGCIAITLRYFATRHYASCADEAISPRHAASAADFRRHIFAIAFAFRRVILRLLLLSPLDIAPAFRCQRQCTPASSRHIRRHFDTLMSQIFSPRRLLLPPLFFQIFFSLPLSFTPLSLALPLPPFRHAMPFFFFPRYHTRVRRRHIIRLSARHYAIAAVFRRSSALDALFFFFFRDARDSADAAATPAFAC
jgi:hypothetical protein